MKHSSACSSQRAYEPSITAIVILLFALGIDVTRARALTHVARKFSSEALEADALHFSTDVWSTIVVIAGVGLVWPANLEPALFNLSDAWPLSQLPPSSCG